MGILDYLNPFWEQYQTPGINPNASTPKPTALGGNLPNIFMTPNLAEAGLLDTELQKNLQQQATKAGLLNAAVSFITQPRNLQAGSALPYLGRAYQQGMASAGDIYGTGLNQLARQQLLAQKSGEDKLYTIDGALVDRQGNVVYQAPPETRGQASASSDIQLLNRYNEAFNKLQEEPQNKLLQNEVKALELKLGLQKQPEPLPTKGEQIKKELTPLQAKIDEKAAQDLLDFTIGGGFSDVQKNLAQLELAKETIKNAPEGSITGPTIGVQDDTGLLKYTNPEAQNVKEQVQEIAQRNLRLILGPQFTAKEGEQLINRVYNPALPQSTNIQRLNLLQEQILSAAKSKQEAVDYYDNEGTLKGFKGRLYNTTTEFLNDYESKLKNLEKPKESISKEKVQTPSRFKEGARTKSKSGKPMIFKNGRWEYE